MRWLRRERGKASIALAGVLLLLTFMVWIPVSAAGAYEGVSGLATPGTRTVQTKPTVQAMPTIDPTIVAATAKEQLRKLERDDDRSFNAWFWNSGSALISSLALVLGGIVAVFKYFSDREAERVKRKEEQDRWLEDRKAEREKRDEEQQRWLKNQEAEREKQAEERFQKVVEGLGSERTEAKVGAVITLRTFLQPGYERFYLQAFDLAVSHLRLRKAEASASKPLSSLAPILIVPKGDLRQEQQLPSPTTPIPLDSLSQALITVFKESFPLVRNELKKNNAQFDPQQLDATDVRLDNAYLVGADFAKAWLERASLCEANLSEVQLEGANLIRAQLEGAGLSGAQIEGANLTRAQLKGANLSYAHLEGANLTRAQLKGADLSYAHLEGANLIRAQLEGANLFDAQLEGANLIWAQLKGANLSGAQLKGAFLIGAQLEGANLSDAHLEGANLSYAHLEGANLIRAQLKGANLKEATPEEAGSLKGTKMNGVTGLTPEQREKCIKKGAIFDAVEQAPTSDASASSSLPPAQSNSAQAPSAPSAQSNTPPPGTDGDSTPSSQQGPEP